MKVRYSYLPQQFENADDLWEELKEFVKMDDETLISVKKKELLINFENPPTFNLIENFQNFKI